MTHYVHLSTDQDRTIAAIATPAGEGGIAIVRISGKEAIAIADQIFSGPVKSYPSHTAHLGKVKDREGKLIDQALLLVMKNPKSYTGEDTVEIQCHGGSFIASQVLQAAFDAGALPAKPGEFTLKAFMNGKIDLSQAEAVQQLIGAKNRAAATSATEHLDGKLSKQIATLQHELTEMAAILEAWVDFPEEGLEFMEKEEMIEHLERTLMKMQKLSQTFSEGKLLSEGISLCLVGPPNAGKSSLMNALLGKEQAIVTEIAGTTRDVLESSFRWGDLHFHLLDTAGIRETNEVIEKEGIRRSKLAAQNADLILCVLDATAPLSLEMDAFLHELPQDKTVIIWNKIDQETAKPFAVPFPHTVAISALHQTHLDELKTAIDHLLFKATPLKKDEVILTSKRHFLAVESATESVAKLIDALNTDVSAEFATFDIKQALSHLGTIIGSDITEEILGSIFSKFCVGK